MIRRLIVVVALALVVSAATVLAHEHKVLGTLTMTASDHVMMTTLEGRPVMVKLTPDTKVTRGKALVKIATVKPGTRIVVTTESDEAPAMLIQVGAAPKPTAKKLTIRSRSGMTRGRRQVQKKGQWPAIRLPPAQRELLRSLTAQPTADAPKVTIYTCQWIVTPGGLARPRRTLPRFPRRVCSTRVRCIPRSSATRPAHAPSAAWRSSRGPSAWTTHRIRNWRT